MKDIFSKILVTLTKREEVKVPALIKGAGGLVYIAGLMALAFFCVTILAKGGYNPFIYFNF